MPYIEIYIYTFICMHLDRYKLTKDRNLIFLISCNSNKWWEHLKGDSLMKASMTKEIHLWTLFCLRTIKCGTRCCYPVLTPLPVADNVPNAAQALSCQVWMEGTEKHLCNRRMEGSSVIDYMSEQGLKLANSSRQTPFAVKTTSWRCSCFWIQHLICERERECVIPSLKSGIVLLQCSVSFGLWCLSVVHLSRWSSSSGDLLCCCHCCDGF